MKLRPLVMAAMVLSGPLSMTLAGMNTAKAEVAPVPSHPGVDAPQLAALGAFSVGVRTLTLVQHNQADILDINPKTGKKRIDEARASGVPVVYVIDEPVVPPTSSSTWREGTPPPPRLPPPHVHASPLSPQRRQPRIRLPRRAQ